MAASLFKRISSQFAIAVSILTFFACNCGIRCNSTEYFTSHEDSYHFHSLFSNLLTELHGYETNIQLHRCMLLTNHSECVNADIYTQTFFIFPSVSKALESNCSSGDIYSCMQSDSFVSGILGILEKDISKSVDDVCCSLAQCQNCEMEGIEPQQVATNGDCHGGCVNCTQFLGIDDAKYIRVVNILQNMTCTKKSFNNFPCAELNIVALNVLSSSLSNKLLQDAKDMIKHCNPTFFEDPARTLSGMIQAPTSDEISNVDKFFSSDAVEIPPTHSQPNIKKGPAKVIGIIFLIIILIASIFVMGWLIRTRILNSRSMTTNFSNVLYSRIDYNHENLDDYSDDDDKGELSMFERA